MKKLLYIFASLFIMNSAANAATTSTTPLTPVAIEATAEANQAATAQEALSPVFLVSPKLKSKFLIYFGPFVFGWDIDTKIAAPTTGQGTLDPKNGTLTVRYEEKIDGGAIDVLADADGTQVGGSKEDAPNSITILKGHYESADGHTVVYKVVVK